MMSKIRERYVMISKILQIRLCLKNILALIRHFYDVSFPSYQRLCVFFHNFGDLGFGLFQWYFSTVQVVYPATSMSSFVTIGPHITKQCWELETGNGRGDGPLIFPFFPIKSSFILLMLCRNAIIILLRH